MAGILESSLRDYKKASRGQALARPELHRRMGGDLASTPRLGSVLRGCLCAESSGMFELMPFAQSRFVRAVVLLVVVASIHSTGRGQRSAELELATLETVGDIGTNRYYTPVNQVLTPAGIQVELPGMRPQGIALSPDGRLLVTAGKTHDLVVIAPATGKILQHVALPSGTNSDLTRKSVSEEILHPDKEGQLSFTGLVFSPDGSRIYLANVDGNIKVFGVKQDGQVAGLFSIPLPRTKAQDRKTDIPAGLAVSPDGKRLYVALNLSNRLAELDAADGHVLRLWDVGVAPYDMVLAGKKAYVSNWGGRRAEGLERYRTRRARHPGAGGPGSAHRRRRFSFSHRSGGGPRGSGEEGSAAERESGTRIQRGRDAR